MCNRGIARWHALFNYPLPITHYPLPIADQSAFKPYTTFNTFKTTVEMAAEQRGRTEGPAAAEGRRRGEMGDAHMTTRSLGCHVCVTRLPSHAALTGALPLQSFMPSCGTLEMPSSCAIGFRSD
jgi:hypothetical protein